MNLSFMDDLSPEAVENDSALNGPGTDEVVESNRCPAVCLEEHLQETETDENHDMDILPHWIVSYYMLGGFRLFDCDLGRVSRPRMTVFNKCSANAVKNNHASF